MKADGTDMQRPANIPHDTPGSGSGAETDGIDGAGRIVRA